MQLFDRLRTHEFISKDSTDKALLPKCVEERAKQQKKLAKEGETTDSHGCIYFRVEQGKCTFNI